MFELHIKTWISSGVCAISRHGGDPFGPCLRGGECAVALYFFHLCDGRDTLIDPDGRMVDDLAGIGDAALKEARG